MSKLDHNGIEIIKDKFYFTTFVPSRLDNNTAHYFTVEDELTYEPFFADFGPLNLGHVYSYCHFLDQKLKDESLAKKKIYHYTGVDGAKRTNAVFLIGAYCVLVLRWSAEMVYRNFVPAVPLLLAYRDASVGTSTFGLTVLECWKGLIKANSCGFFDLQTFDPNEYYFYERVENGDMNWIVPGKFLAFSGPHASHHSEAGLRTLTPEDYIPYFKKHNVASVVRLNKKVYDKKRFVDYGIKHHDLYFVDGSTPSDNIVQRFLEIVENETGAIAVHCKAGLGRTGTLIGCSLIKHHKFTAHEAIAWLRICRPGSVIGPQQHFLVQMQSNLWKEGDLYRKKQDGSHSKNAKIQLLRATTSSTLQSDYNGNSTVYETAGTAVVGFSNGNGSSNMLLAAGSGAVTTTSTTSTSTTSTSTNNNSTKSHTTTKVPPPSSTTTSTITTTTQITTSNLSLANGGGSSAYRSVGDSSSKQNPATTSTTSLVPSGNSLVDGNYLTSNAPPSSANTKERLKADMRLITATLKSMRTTPPTTPTHMQPPPPKFSSSTDLSSSSSSSSPYTSTSAATSNNNATSSSSFSSPSPSSSSTMHLHHSTPSQSGHNQLANSTNSSNGTHRSISPSSSSSPASLTASSSSAAITNFYLNSPYAPSRTSYSPSRTSNPSSTTKSKSPSGLSLQHRKIENQTHRSSPITSSSLASSSSSSSPASSSSSSSSSSLLLLGGGGGSPTTATGGNSRQQSTKNLTASSKLATRGTSPTVVERHTSPLPSSLSRSLASSTTSSSSSTHHHGPTANTNTNTIANTTATTSNANSNTTTTTTKPTTTIYHRKSRSSGNVLASASSSSSSSSGPPPLAASSSSATSFSSQTPNGSFARPNAEFAVHSHTTTRSISNGPPSSSYHQHPFYSSSSNNPTTTHSGSITGVGVGAAAGGNFSSSFHLSGSLQPASSPSALRSKTPSPPRRHSSVSKNISNYPSYLVDTYQKKSDHHSSSRGYLRP